MLLFQQPFGINALVGLIALSGILMRNTLILIGQIRQNEKDGLAPFDAVVEATVQRSRPVILTALAAMLAFIPLTHSVFWGTLAYTLIGGTFGGTVLTLVFLPALYAIWFKIKPVAEGDVSGRLLSNSARAAVPTPALAPIQGGSGDALPGGECYETLGSAWRCLATVLVVVGVLAGCTVWTELQAARGHRAGGLAKQPERGDSLGDLGWWELFKDPTLHELIATAVVANRDLQVAVARVLESRAQLGVARAAQFPGGQCRRQLPVHAPVLGEQSRRERLAEPPFTGHIRGPASISPSSWTCGGGCGGPPRRPARSCWPARRTDAFARDSPMARTTICSSWTGSWRSRGARSRPARSPCSSSAAVSSRGSPPSWTSIGLMPKRPWPPPPCPIWSAVLPRTKTL